MILCSSKGSGRDLEISLLVIEITTAGCMKSFVTSLKICSACGRVYGGHPTVDRFSCYILFGPKMGLCPQMVY